MRVQRSPDFALYLQMLGEAMPPSMRSTAAVADVMAPQSAGLPWGLAPEDAVQAHQSRLEQRIYSHPDPKIRSVTAAVERVMRSSLPPKQKEREVERIRNEAGLSKKEMKKQVTGRLQNIYKDAKKEVKHERDAAHQKFERVIKDAKKVYGKDHPVIDRLKAMQTNSLRTLKEYEQGLGVMEKQYGSLYRPWWSKAIDVAAKWGPLALNFIPGVGPVAYWAVKGAVSAYNVSKYGWKNGLMMAGMDMAMSGFTDSGTFKLPGLRELQLPEGLQPGINAANSARNGDFLGAVYHGTGAINPYSSSAWIDTVQRGAITGLTARDTYNAARNLDVPGALEGFDQTREQTELTRRMIEDRVRRGTRSDIPKK